MLPCSNKLFASSRSNSLQRCAHAVQPISSSSVAGCSRPATRQTECGAHRDSSEASTSALVSRRDALSFVAVLPLLQQVQPAQAVQGLTAGRIPGADAWCLLAVTA